MLFSRKFCRLAMNFVIDCRSRLFGLFHALATKEMKEDILSELKAPKSRLRVIFATTALGMGVDAPNIENIIHISPLANLESYVQEIGKAGIYWSGC